MYSCFYMSSLAQILFLNIWTYQFNCRNQYKVINCNPWNTFFKQAIKIQLTILMPVENVTGFIGLGFSSCISNWVDLSLCWAKSRATGRSELSCKKSKSAIWKLKGKTNEQRVFYFKLCLFISIWCQPKYSLYGKHFTKNFNIP